MSEQSVALEQEFESRVSDPVDPAFVANLQHSANLANENCDRAVALAHKLSAQLREAQDRINQLEREADGFSDQFLAEAKAVIQEVQSNADARVKRTTREADGRIARLKAEAQNEIGRLQEEVVQATLGIEQVKIEADKYIERIKIEADVRVADVEAEAKKRIDLIQRENEHKVIRLEADLGEAKNRADRAEGWLVLIRREIEDHLMPSVTAMRDGPKPTNPAACSRSVTVPTPSRSSAITWFRRFWLRVTATAVARVGTDTEFDRAPQYEREHSNAKNGNTVRATEPSALRSGGNSAPPDWVSGACNGSDRVKLGVAEQDINREPACNTMAPPTDATTARNARPPIHTSGGPSELQQDA